MAKEIKSLVEKLAKNYEKGCCPRCGKINMNEKDILNSLSRYCNVFICNHCGLEEALSAMSTENALPFQKWAIMENYFSETKDDLK